MGTCETCGNNYHKSIQIIAADNTKHIFDCFECAIQALAPVCEHCGCKVIGHGIEEQGSCFCCTHCASSMLADNKQGSKPSNHQVR